MSDTLKTDTQPSPGFTIFRRDEAPPLRSRPIGGLTDVSRAGFANWLEAGKGAGAEARVLFEAPGFTLIYVWFKSGFPLFRHSHGPDCLYEVIGGSLQLGGEVLRKGDGFFIPAESAYAFEVGPEGVEILEFRHEPIGGTVMHANNPRFWEKAVETMRERREQWLLEPRPN